MNIYLIPYTFRRHLVMGMMLGAVGLIAWWWSLFLVLEVGPWMYESLGWLWWPRTEGWLYLVTLSTSVAFMSVFYEGSLRRRRMRWRIFWALFGAGIAWVGVSIGLPLVRVMMPLFTNDQVDELLRDPSFLTLRYRMSGFILAGFWSGLGPFFARRLHAVITRNWTWGGRDGPTPTPAPGWIDWGGIVFAHLGGGLGAGVVAAAAWHMPGYYDDLAGDLYLAPAFAAWIFGTLHGLLVWPIPEDMYAGWIRVLSYERYGLRIPIPHTDDTAAERFLGHFPRGLDLYLPAETKVMELHTSFTMDGDRNYTVRGLSIEPTVVKRPLERIDLRYDPRRPAPLETQLRMEDRILLGADGDTVIEFLMLPKEER
ncbi:MAG: hypothetical protein KC621_31415 [Myxococcales bacterium]|nr:hypothetical protein [Myxococcales bacterium]